MITDISQLDKKVRYTYADYLTWRFKEMVELIKGKLYILSPAPAERHQRLVTNLTIEIGSHFKGKSCHVYVAPFDVRLVKAGANDSEVSTVVQPDICVICDSNKIDEKGCAGAPDLIVEILSPASSKKDLNEKFNLYEENGVQEYWVVFPDSNVVNQYLLTDGVYEQTQSLGRSDTLRSAIFPDLVIDLRQVF
jgi:Uma2 family endonuclease